MKVLFAVNNENISESIIKKYQQEYKEIISSKNVYYFNAIIKELQKDKSYDRIVISEDLEPFANNNYEVIDKFIFEKLDHISDEATANDGQDIPIILICADRRTKSENLLVKLFGIGVYSALLGQDRSITNVCELINKPRNKKDAKVYYRIDSDDVEYRSENEGDVSEVEIQNILNHYKRLGKNEEKYVESFASIAAQYTDAQLRVICRFLPLSVKAVLEANSQKYQELITFGTVTPSVAVKGKAKEQEKYRPNSDYYDKKEKKTVNKMPQKDAKLDVLERNIGKSNLTKPVVIPSSMNVADVKKSMPETEDDNILGVGREEENELLNKINEIETQVQPQETQQEDLLQDLTDLSFEDITEETPEVEEPVKRKRGRPRKVKPENLETGEETVKRKRGRPRKVEPQPEVQEVSDENILPGFEDFDDEEDKQEDINLFELGNEEDSNEQPTGGIILPGFEDFDDEDEEENSKVVNQVEEPQQMPYTPPSYEKYRNENEKQLENTNQRQYENMNLDSLLTRDKKVVAFVGTSKNGTSFLVNNLAEMMSKKGIKTAILDLTKNKNAYYIYTQNEESLRKKAYNCIANLRNGIIDGIEVSKNLTVFTTLPDQSPDVNDYQNILATLAKNYSLVLMDCDFETNYGYFNNAQEIYLVQSFDILTIQPLTAFLRDLKSKNILRPEKIRVVLNKVLRVRSITERTIIGGMAYYNDPAMSFMTELFDKDNVKYSVIPFEEQTYSRYLEGLVNCQISTNGYSKNFIQSLEKLSNMVYPLLSNNDKMTGRMSAYSADKFSSNMNATLNKMKNNY